MITLKKSKRWFLDRDVVIKRLGRAKVKVFMRWGGKVRTIARRSMRYRKLQKKVKGKFVKQYSPAGNPPFAHKETGALLRGLLEFALDPQTDTVVVGSEGGGRKIRGSRRTVPALHEFGGTSARHGRVLRYPQRSYMAPALEMVAPSLPDYWKNTIGP